jgi:hypothetical protein
MRTQREASWAQIGQISRILTGFVAVNPNSKIPALVDRSAGCATIAAISIIKPHVLRRIDPSDDEMLQLVQSGMLPFDRSLLKAREFLVRFNHPAMRAAVDGGLQPSEVAATSLALTELITALLAANRSFGGDAVMPTVRVAAGSVDFLATGPGLIVGGLSLLATCGVSVISAPVIAGTARVACHDCLANRS